MPARALPRPLDLAARVLMASVLVMGLLWLLERPVVKPLIPVFRAAIGLLAPEFTITSAEMAHEGPSEIVRFRANLTVPMKYAGYTLYPFGWNPSIPRGGFQILLTLGAILEYCALMLIVVVAWPAQHAQEFLLRLAVSVPLLGLLLLINVPFAVVAELWNQLHDDFAPHSVCVWMVWSRFLMGGGGLVLGCLLGAVAIAGARRLLTPRTRPARETGYARLVLSRQDGGRNDPPMSRDHPPVLLRDWRTQAADPGTAALNSLKPVDSEPASVPPVERLRPPDAREAL